MAKLRIMLEVDTIELFDALNQMSQDCEPLGQRLASTLLTGDPGLADRVGLSFYGIEFKSKESVDG
jgi:hypothetical protein